MMMVLLFLADNHSLIPRATFEAVNGVRGRAHGGGDR